MNTSNEKARDSQAKPAPPARGYHEQIINSLTSGVIAVDRDGVIVAVNRAARAFLQASEDKLFPGNRIQDVPEVKPFVEIMGEVEKAKAPVSRRDIILTGGDQTKKEIGLSASPLEGPDGLNGVIFLFTDMTERRKLERAAELNRQLAQVGELTVGVVHELRNSVTVVSGLAELLMRRLDPEDGGRQSAEAIFREAAHLEKSIAQFLGFARPFEIEPVRCHPENIVDRALQLCQRRAERKSVPIDHTIQADLPEMQADVSRAAQTVVNIVNNAVDAVPQKGGKVILNTFRDGPDIVFQITDNGPGIHLGPGEDLFKPFFSKKGSGTGLGLAIAHRIVSAHNGSISYENLEEGGARFEVRLPIQKGALW